MFTVHKIINNNFTRLFVFAGIGIIILGFVVFAGLILAGLSFPLLLVMLLPLAVVWLFIAITRKTEA